LDMQVCGRNGVNGFVVVVGWGDVRRDSYTRRLTLNLENLSTLAPNLSDPVFILVKATAARSGYANAQALMMSNLRAHAKNVTHTHTHTEWANERG
jgi:hypothetical protein